MPYIADFEIGEGDFLPELRRAITDDAGAPLDLTGATVKFSMASIDGPAKITSAPASIIGDPKDGVVGYTWHGTDTDTPGWYIGEFRPTFPDTRSARVPTSEKLHIFVSKKVA
jgi:hypothetical protein